MVTKRFAIVVAVLLTFGMLIPPSATAAPAGGHDVSKSSQIRDVALHAEGTLVGQLLDAQGVAVVGATVAVGKVGKEVARVQTNQQGKFRVAGLTGGVYQVLAAGRVSAYRLWAPNTAPPAAQKGLLLVSGTDVVRGQYGCGAVGCGTPVCGSPVCGNGCGGGCVYGRGACGGGIVGWMADHPVITTGAIAAAIAIPLAVDDDDSPATP